MIEFVDTHTHLFVKEFDDDRELAVKRAVESGVTRLCLPSIDETSYAPIMEMCDRVPGVCYGMIGLHPTEVNDGYGEILDRMYARLQQENRFIASAHEEGGQIIPAFFRGSQNLLLAAAVDLIVAPGIPHQMQEHGRIGTQAGDLLQFPHRCFQHLGKAAKMV